MAKEYIERDALIEDFKSCGADKELIDAIIFRIYMHLAADVVEVVRCKDCKNWKHFKHLGCTDSVKVCGLANYMIGANGYCLYGERRDNNAAEGY